MPDMFDRATGVAVRTSAALGIGSWVPGMEMHRGVLWTVPFEGSYGLAFDLAHGKTLFGFARDELKQVRKVKSGFNTIIEITVDGDAGGSNVFTLVGPRGRMKKIFAAVGIPL